MNILSIEETGTIPYPDAKESDRLKREVYEDCAERVKDFLLPEQLERFRDSFNVVAAGYIFKK